MQAKPTHPTKTVHERFKTSAREWVDSGKWANVTSSNAAKIAYIKLEKTLVVRFKSGAQYEYYTVPEHVAVEMFYASSTGKFIWKRIRGKYPYQKVND